MEELQEQKEEQRERLFNLGKLPTIPIGLSPSVIKGILRRGGKLAISAPKKSLKTSLAIHLSLVIATGGEWLGWKCQKLKVLFVNINQRENDCLVRFANIINTMGDIGEERHNIDVLTLDKSITLTKTVEAILKASQANQYNVVIIDSLDDICAVNGWGNVIASSLDKITNTLNCGLVFTHSHRHLPKGNAEARELAEWSEVLNYSDTLLEFIKLEIDPEILRLERLNAVWELSKTCLHTHAKNYYHMNIKDSYVTRKNSTSEQLRQHLEIALHELPKETTKGILQQFDAIDLRLKYRTYWRLEIVTSNAPVYDPTDYLFYYPILQKDHDKILIYHEPGKKLDKRILENNHLLVDTREEVTERLSKQLTEFTEKFDRYPRKVEFAEFCKISRPTLDKELETAKESIAFIDGKIQFL
ncbi:AAA family ATPase [Aerococcaceae bacterium NML191219]|nr:AAA family ATPase [Aerococcaceae bacterium NML191219]